MADNIPSPLATPRQPSTGPKPFIGPTAPPSARTPGAQAPSVFNPRRGPSAPDRANNPNRVANVIGKVGDYLENVARSARDIPTALGTAMDSRGAMARGERFAKTYPNATPSQVRAMSTQPIKNLGNQVGQVAKSIAGKKDTSRSDQYFGKDNTYLEVNDSTGSWSKLEDSPKPFRGRK